MYDKDSDNCDKIFQTPTIPSEIYDCLPDILKESTSLFETEIEKDVFLAGALGVLSGCLPNVNGKYMNEVYGPQLFVFVTAPAGSGKGTMKWSRYFGQSIHEEKYGKYKEEFELYESSLETYNLSDKKQKQNMEKPHEPARELFFIPANSSSSAFIKALEDNGFRAVIFETEADTLANAFKQEWGNFSDVLRKSWHHEYTTLIRRSGNEIIDISDPHIAMVLSGTPKQVHNMMPEVENGLFSRVLFYAFVDDGEFINPFISYANTDYIDFFKNKGTQIHELYNHLICLKEQIEFRFTEEQGVWFTNEFKIMLKRNKLLLGRDFDANIKRLGLMTFRIAMIFSVLRILEHSEYLEIITCNDVDFQNAMKIASVLEKHAIAVYKNLPNVKLSGVRQKYFDELPQKFDRQTYLKVSHGLEIKDKTAEKYVKIYCDVGLLHHEHNHYSKK